MFLVRLTVNTLLKLLPRTPPKLPPLTHPPPPFPNIFLCSTFSMTLITVEKYICFSTSIFKFPHLREGTDLFCPVHHCILMSRIEFGTQWC